MYKCSLERMSDKIKTFAKFGDAGHGGITRYSLSPEAHQAREEFKRRMEAIGAKVECDDVACMYATLEGSDPNAKRIVMGSHCDSVKNGGNYDGIEGVMTGMEVLETVAAENIPHKHPLTAMIWTNEEGSLYPPAMMVSGIICYDYLPDYLKPNFKYENMMASKPMDESEFANFGEALAATPFKGPKENRISQLVMGMFNYRVRFHGFTAHAGTFPMAKRHDALHAAADFLCKLHERYDAYNKELVESGESEYEFVFTTGEIYVHPCIHTCIPDEAEFSLDVRHPDQKVLDKCMDILKEMAGEMYQQCTCDIEEQWKRDPVPFDKNLIGFVEESMDELGLKWQKILSGAGHDAQFCAYMIPTTMIFSRTKDGLSHCEPEHVSDEDCTAAASATLNAVLKADKFYD